MKGNRLFAWNLTNLSGAKEYRPSKSPEHDNSEYKGKKITTSMTFEALHEREMNCCFPWGRAKVEACEAGDLPTQLPNTWGLLIPTLYGKSDKGD